MLFTVAQSGYRGDVTGRKRDIDYLQGEIQELFADLWQVPRFAGLRRGFRPQSDCFRTEDPPALHVVIELPGVDPDSVEVVAANRTLLITSQGPGLATIGASSSSWNDRILQIIGGNLTVTFQNLTITGGHAVDGGVLGGDAALGGGLLIDGAQVALSNVSVNGNQAFERRIELGEDVDTAAATARYDHGMLKIVLPIAQRKARQGKVPVDIGRRETDA